MSDNTQPNAFACPSCGQGIQADPKFTGLPMECPNCRSVVIVPNPGTMMESTSEGPEHLPPPPQGMPTPPEIREPSATRRKKRIAIIAGIVLLLLLLLVLALLTRGGAGGGARGKRGAGANQGSGPALGSNADGTLPYDAGKGDQATQGSEKAAPPVDADASSKAILFEHSDPTDIVQGGTGSIGGGGTSFFGLSASGGSFVYIVDSSGSMRGEKLKIAKESLLSSIAQLDEKQRFFVFFYDTNSYPMPGDEMVAATAANKAACRKWVNNRQAGDRTLPERSLRSAIKMKPEVIFFLSDGQFEHSVCDRIKAVQGEDPIPINSIGFGKNAAEAVLKRLASDSGGLYHFVPLANPAR